MALCALCLSNAKEILYGNLCLRGAFGLITLTSLIEEVGTWEPPVLASACRDESRDVIISRMAAIFDVDAVSKMSPEEEEKIQTNFAEAFDAMDLVQAYIFSVNLPSLISGLNGGNRNLEEWQFDVFQKVWYTLLKCDSPLVAFSLENIKPWTRHSSLLKLMKKQDIAIEYLKFEGDRLKLSDPALWVVIQEAVIPKLLNEVADQEKVPHIQSALDAILKVYEKYDWTFPSERVVWHILDGVVECNPELPLFELCWSLYQEHLSWIKRVCDHVAISGEDREGLVGLWNAAQAAF